MPDELKQDQVAAPAQVVEPGQSEKGSALPESGHFSGDSMLKFYEQLELVGDKAPAEKVPEKKAAKKEPCVDCPEGETEAKPRTEERKPIKVLKVKGEDRPVYSEDELTELAQKGAHYTQERQKDADWERDLNEREAKLERMAPAIQELLARMDRGEKLPGEGSQETKPEAEEDPILDPAAEKHIKAMRAELDEMKRENVVLKQSHQQEFTKKVQTELTNTFNEVTKETPFEQVVHEDGRNITQEVFSSMAAFKANVDFLKQKQDPKFKMKTIQEYFADTARDLAYLEKHHKSNGNVAEMTPELVKKSNPKVAEALGKEAIEAWLKANEDGSSPVVRPSKTEPSVTAGTRNIKSLDDGLAQALADPDIAAELEKMGKQKSVFYHGGK